MDTNPSSETNPLLQLEGVSFHWKDGKGFNNLSLSLNRGDFALISGPSGEGKSTLLRLLVRLEEPQQGRILLAGTSITEMPPPLLRRRVALVRQLPIMGGHTVREALLLPFTMAANADLPKPDDAAMQARLAEFLLEGVTLETEAASLSPGQQQRVSLLRSLLLEPEMLLLDEPTSALDTESRRTVEEAIEAANVAGTTVVLITHTDYTPARTRQGLRHLVLHGGVFTETDTPPSALNLTSDTETGDQTTISQTASTQAAPGVRHDA